MLKNKATKKEGKQNNKGKKSTGICDYRGGKQKNMIKEFQYTC